MQIQINILFRKEWLQFFKSLFLCQTIHKILLRFQKGKFFSVPPYSGQVLFSQALNHSQWFPPLPPLLPPFPPLLRNVWIGKNIIYVGFSTTRSFRRLLEVLEQIPADKGGGLLHAIHPSDCDSQSWFYVTALLRDNSQLIKLDPLKLYNPGIQYIDRVVQTSSNLILEDICHPRKKNLHPGATSPHSPPRPAIHKPHSTCFLCGFAHVAISYKWNCAVRALLWLASFI